MSGEGTKETTLLLSDYKTASFFVANTSQCWVDMYSPVPCSAFVFGFLIGMAEFSPRSEEMRETGVTAVVAAWGASGAEGLPPDRRRRKMKKNLP